MHQMDPNEQLMILQRFCENITKLIHGVDFNDDVEVWDRVEICLHNSSRRIFNEMNEFDFYKTDYI